MYTNVYGKNHEIKWTFSFTERGIHAVQTDGSACGLHTIAMIVHYVRTGRIATAEDFDQSDVTNYRMYIAHVFSLAAAAANHPAACNVTSISRESEQPITVTKRSSRSRVSTSKGKRNNLEPSEPFILDFNTDEFLTSAELKDLVASGELMRSSILKTHQQEVIEITDDDDDDDTPLKANDVIVV